MNFGKGTTNVHFVMCTFQLMKEFKRLQDSVCDTYDVKNLK